jgi:type II secretion system protein C
VASGEAAASAADARPLRSGRPFDWRAQAPRLSAAVLAALGIAELVYIGRNLLSVPAVPPPVGALKARPVSVHWWRLSSAHLFGVPPTPEEQQAAQALARPIEWALTGVIATGDPARGFAIVGERGKVLQVLRAGAPLEAFPGSHLSQIFSDHVVIDLAGREQRIELPRDRAAAASRDTQAAGTPAAQPFTPEPPPPRAMAPPTPPLVSALNAEAYPADGRVAGMILHPALPLQRRYGVRDGDVVTAVNGVQLTDPAILETAIRMSGESAQLTITREGVEQTVSVPTSGR